MQQPAFIPQARAALHALPDLCDRALRARDPQPPDFGSDALPLEECMRELDALLASLDEN